MAFSMEPDEHDDRAFRLVGELDLATSPVLMETASPLAATGGDIRLDLAGLSFIDSSGIRTLLILAETLGERSRLVLVTPAESVLRTLELVGIDQARNIEISTTAS